MRLVRSVLPFLRRHRVWVGFGIVLLLGSLFVWELTTTPTFVVDDAFITLDYSKNLVHGRGPTYGHGLRVEGYSNFLWMVILAIPLGFAPLADPIMLARGAMVPFVGLLFVATFALARARASTPLALIAVGLLAINVNVVLAYDSALETVPYVALLTAAFAAYVRGTPTLRRAVVPLFTATALMRIDGFIPFAFVMGFDALRNLSQRRFSWLDWLRFWLPGVALWAIWFAWRWSYYGLPLPSTYYAKALIPKLLPQRGPDYVMDEMLGSGLCSALAGFLWLLWRQVRLALPIGLFALLQLGYAAHVGGDWMPTGRFVMPAFPLLITLLVWAAQELSNTLGERSVSYPRFVAAPLLALLCWLGSRSEPHSFRQPYVGYKLARAVHETQHVRSLMRAVSFLDAAVPVGGRLVTDYGGVFAYYTHATPIEMWGLCNAMIATRGDARTVNPIYGRTCPACYPDLDPQYFHVAEPIVRGKDDFQRHEDVVRGVWQSDAIGRYLDVMGTFVSGRVIEPRTQRAAWFLERKAPDWRPRPRRVAGKVIEYPFVPGGLLAD